MIKVFDKVEPPALPRKFQQKIDPFRITGHIEAELIQAEYDRRYDSDFVLADTTFLQVVRIDNFFF